MWESRSWKIDTVYDFERITYDMHEVAIVSEVKP
jgi:hypothetical protein